MALSKHDSAVLNCIFNPNLPFDETDDHETNLEDLDDISDCSKRAKNLEIQAINLAETGNHPEALRIINQAMEICPTKASLYNNRAQIHQFLLQLPAALDDLDKAIQLAGETQLKTLCQALCQRGLIHQRANRIDAARTDFEAAARLGSRFARNHLVQLNPYAALCNQMLRKVMDES